MQDVPVNLVAVLIAGVANLAVDFLWEQFLAGDEFEYSLAFF